MAWKNACRSKEEGGLGIINLRTHNVALLLKYLHKFYSKADLRWVHLTWNCTNKNNSRPPHLRKNVVGSFWRRDVISLSQDYFMISTCKLQSGVSISSWLDLWDLGVLRWRFPQIFSFARQPELSVSKFLS